MMTTVRLDSSGFIWTKTRAPYDQIRNHGTLECCTNAQQAGH